ncbi:MAG: hypothetical protein ACOYYU_02550 [Chloroflexota bacterium]
MPKQNNAGAKGPWSGLRPWIGGVAIVFVTWLEYYLIANGYPSVKDGGWGWPPSILVPVVGLIAFFGTLLIANIFSASPDLSAGEVRKAITAAVLVVYFFFIVLLLFSSSSPIYRLPANPAGSIAAEETTPAGTPQAASPDETTVEESSDQDTQAGGEGEQANVTSEAAAQEINTPLDLAASVINAFTALTATVIGFYFTTRTAENITRTIKGGDQQDE